MMTCLCVKFLPCSIFLVLVEICERKHFAEIDSGMACKLQYFISAVSWLKTLIGVFTQNISSKPLLQ